MQRKGWLWLPEFVVILNAVLKFTGCLLGKAGNGMRGVKEGTQAEGLSYMKEMADVCVQTPRSTLDGFWFCVNAGQPITLSTRHTLKQSLKCIQKEFLNVATITELIDESYKNRLLKQN